jgi:FlaG/FlaF family flagellin (archaellin)
MHITANRVTNMKAVDPVIATVIIVAVAIAISIAVALWITGLTSSFTGVEKLEVVNAYAETKTDSSGNTYWQVTIIVKNTGTKPATIDSIFINGKAGDMSKVYHVKVGGTGSATGSFTVNQGEEYNITFYLNGSGASQPSPVLGVFSSGQTVSIVIHTASGGRYPASVNLP